MTVRQCMSENVTMCAPTDTIQKAARTMLEIDAGALPVAENDRLVGMITDRDIAVRAVAQGAGPETAIRDAMSNDIRYCYDDEAMQDVAAQMSELQVRRMPVLNRDKRLVGIVSLGDVARVEPATSVRAMNGVARPGGQHMQ